MENQNFKAYFNINDRTQSVDFSVPTDKISEETKNESAHISIKDKHPEFTGKNILISKVDIFE